MSSAERTNNAIGCDLQDSQFLQVFAANVHSVHRNFTFICCRFYANSVRSHDLRQNATKRQFIFMQCI